MTALNYVRHLAGGGVGAVHGRRSLALRFRSPRPPVPPGPPIGWWRVFWIGSSVLDRNDASG